MFSNQHTTLSDGIDKRRITSLEFKLWLMELPKRHLITSVLEGPYSNGNLTMEGFLQLCFYFVLAT